MLTEDVMIALEKECELQRYEDIFNRYEEQFRTVIVGEYPNMNKKFFINNANAYPYICYMLEIFISDFSNRKDLNNALMFYVDNAKAIVKDLRIMVTRGDFENRLAPLLYEDCMVKYQQWSDSLSEKGYAEFLEFPFLDCMRPHSQVKYLIEELRVKTIRALLTSVRTVSYLPENTMSLPLFTIGNADAALETKVIGDKVCTYYENTTETGHVRIIVQEISLPKLKSLPKEEQEEMLASIAAGFVDSKKLDGFDLVVLQAIYQCLTAYNIYEAVLTFPFKDFVKKCYPDKKLYDIDYQKVEKALSKLAGYYVQLDETDGLGRSVETGGLYLLSCKINYNDALVGKKDYYSSALLRFSISERLRENWLNQGNYEMYTPQYRQISDITQKVLVFPLQRERLVAAKENSNKSILGLDFFLSKVNYEGERKNFKRMIKKHLDALKDSGILIQEVSWSTKFVEITWQELTDAEREVYGVNKLIE